MQAPRALGRHRSRAGAAAGQPRAGRHGRRRQHAGRQQHHRARRGRCAGQPAAGRRHCRAGCHAEDAAAAGRHRDRHRQRRGHGGDGRLSRRPVEGARRHGHAPQGRRRRGRREHRRAHPRQGQPQAAAAGAHGHGVRQGHAGQGAVSRRGQPRLRPRHRRRQGRHRGDPAHAAAAQGARLQRLGRTRGAVQHRRGARLVRLARADPATGGAGRCGVVLRAHAGRQGIADAGHLGHRVLQGRGQGPGRARRCQPRAGRERLGRGLRHRAAHPGPGRQAARPALQLDRLQVRCRGCCF